MARILQVVAYFPPDRVGGVGEVAAHLHAGLLARGHESEVLSSGHSGQAPGVHRLARTPGGFVLGSLRGFRAARRADVIHVHHGEAAPLLLALRLLGSRAPILLTLHVGLRAMRPSLTSYQIDGRRYGGRGPGLMERIGLAFRTLLDDIAVACADRVTFISRSAARDVLGVDRAAEAQVIYNALPPAPLATHAPETRPEPVDLLFVGTNSTRKRVAVLPLVLAAVRRQRPSATLRIVGSSAEENPEVAAIARELDLLSAIEFVGKKDSRELGPYYEAAGVLLVPSAYEGLPMVILEAFRAGLPCVATDVSGHPEVVVPGENGLLVPVDQPEAMAQAALQVLEDPALRARMSTAARETLRVRFGVERQVDAYLGVYAELGATT